MPGNNNVSDDAPSNGQDAKGASSKAAQPADALRTVDLDTLLTTRHSRRRRLARVAFPVVALLTLVIVLSTVFGGPIANLTRLFEANIGNVQTLAITANVATARVTFNGAQLGGAFPLVATLREGENDLTINAQPFNQLQCQLTWHPMYLLSPTPGCDDITPTSVHINNARAQPKWLLNLYLSDPNLPASLQPSALSVVAQGLGQVTAQTSVPTGDYISTGLTSSSSGEISISSAQAPEPLTATIAFALATGLDTLGVQPPCIIGTLCGASPQALAGDALALSPMPGVAQVWLVSAQAGVRWRFTDATGKQMAESPLVALTTTALVELAYTPSSSAPWSILSIRLGAPSGAATTPETEALKAQLGPAACNSGYTALTAELPKGSITSAGLIATAGIAGCLIQAQAGTSAANTANSVYLWRFGVLLAVDANAKHLNPGLPLAPTDEVAAIKTAANAQ